MSTPHPGWAEQEPAHWWDATVETIQAVLAEGVSAEDIAGVGLSGQMHSSVFLDEADEVIRPALLWCDGRTTAQREWITDAAGGKNALRDMVANEGFTVPKVIWLRDEEPEEYAKLKTLLLAKDYIRFQLTGEKLMEVSDAAGTAMFDVIQRRWSDELLSKIGVDPSILPQVRESVDDCGQITKKAATATGLKAGTVVAGGGADNTCGATGCGVVTPGRVLSSLGTSGVVFAPTTSVAVDPDMRVHTFCHSVPDQWYLMGVVLSAGGSLRWFRDVVADGERAAVATVGQDPYDVLADRAGDVAAGSEGLSFLPYLAGERTPHKDASAKGAYVGLTLRHGRSHLIRATFEGITYALHDSMEIIRDLGIPIDQIRCTGGGAKSDFWLQMQADIYNAPVVTVNSGEGPAMGAALMGGVAGGVFDDLAEAADEFVSVVTTAEPNPAVRNAYDDGYGLFRELYPALKKPFANASEVVARHHG